MKGLYPPSFKGLYCLFYLCLIRDTLGFPRYAQSSSALPGLTGIFLGYPSFHRFIRCALYCTIYFIYSILNFMQSLLAMQGLTTLPLISPSWKLHQIFDFTVSTRLIEFHWVVTWVLFSEDSLDLIRFYPFSFTVTRYDLVFTGQVSTCWLHFSLEIHWVLLSFYLMILNSLCFTKFSFQTGRTLRWKSVFSTFCRTLLSSWGAVPILSKSIQSSLLRVWSDLDRPGLFYLNARVTLINPSQSYSIWCNQVQIRLIKQTLL